MAGFTTTTFAQIKTDLANRLGDPTKTYWSDTELGLYIIEALRTWGLLTGYWRDTGQLNTVAGTPLYNITSIQNTGGEDLLTYTVTDSNVVSMIQYHLLEPATGTSWTGSEQFTLADLTGAITRRRDCLIGDTDAVLTETPQVIPANDPYVDLDQSTLGVRRLGWTGVSGTNWPLYPEDIDAQRNFGSDYMLTPGTPQSYSTFSVKPLRLRVAPPPNENGTLTILASYSGAPLDASGITLGIPDDMSWIVKWGALADIFGKEGPGQDLARSYFCERRWKLGIALARINSLVVDCEINGVAMKPESLHRIDSYSPNWYSTQGTPTMITNLRNYIGLATCPDGVYNVQLYVVRKAIVPTLNTDFIQIGEDYINNIIDYAEHLAAFKSSGMEFRHTYRAAESFFNGALSYNQGLAAGNPALVELIRQSTLDDYDTPQQKDSGNKPLQSTVANADQTEQFKQLYKES